MQADVFAPEKVAVICVLVANCAAACLCMHIVLYHSAYVHVNVSMLPSICIHVRASVHVCVLYCVSPAPWRT